jgi:acyl carrier protein
MTITEIKKKVRDYLTPHFDGRQVKDNDDIYSSGIIDSYSATKMAGYLEREFSITITQRDREANKCRCIDDISRFVLSKMK